MESLTAYSVANQLGKDEKFLDDIAKRAVELMTASNNKGSKEVSNVGGGLYITANQLERLKKSFIFLLNHDDEFRVNVRRILRKFADEKVAEPLSQAEMLRRIGDFGPLGLLHKGRIRMFFADDIFSAFGEYSRNEVKQMLKDNRLLMGESCRKDKRTGTNKRVYILDI